MIKSTFSILFLIRKSHLGKSGESPISMRITVNGRFTEMSTLRKVLANHFGRDQRTIMPMVCSWTKPRIGLRIIHNREPKLPEQIEFGIHVALILYPPMGISPPMRGAARDYRQVGCASRDVPSLHPVDARSVLSTSLIEFVRPHPCLGCGRDIA